MSPFMYVMIAGIAVFPISFAFKVIVDRIKSDRMTLERGHIVFFITAAVIEIIPIILVVYAFSQQATAATVTGMDDLIVPGLLVLVFMGIGAFFILLQSIVGVAEEMKQRLIIFAMIGISLSNAIPIICLVGLFMMLP